MNKKDLEALVKECISEVVAEGYDEFQRADKGSKGIAAKDKAEEDTYGAGYAAGEKAAKSKYKKLAEAYKQLKEEGFGLGPKGLDTNDDLDEIEGKPKMTSDAQAIINIIEKQPMLVQKLSLVSDRRELEDIFDYLITRLNPQFAKNATGIRTAANNAVQKFAKDDEELDEARFEKGTDIGKPGKGFEKIAKAAEKRYGSKEAGQKVAGAILKKVLKK